MRLTLALLFASLTIYCNGTVLSLPPSLIANAASLRRPSSTTMSRELEDDEDTTAAASLGSLNTLWKKDTRYLIDTSSGGERAADGFDSGARRIQSIQAPNSNLNLNNHNSNINSNNYKARSATAAKAAHQRGMDLNRKLAAEYDLNALLAAVAASTTSSADDEMDAVQSAELLFPPLPPSPQEIAPSSSSEFFTPLKYWARNCQQSNNCPQEYYRALSSNSNKAAALQQLQDEYVVPSNNDDIPSAEEEPNADITENIGLAANVAIPLAANDYVNNDVFMLLTGELDLIKFLHWAMEQLYTYQKFANSSGGNGAEAYYPGMYNWKKLNLSGRLEPTMMVEEPHYVIVRREQLQEDLAPDGSNYHDDPFIPPRGRKHHLPDLDALLQRYETFVPNRGKRDKIKDIFKYDDLFFPNRGKKQRAPNKTKTKSTTTNSETKLENEQLQQRELRATVDAENDDDDDDENAPADNLTAPPSSSRTMTAMHRVMAKLKKKLLQQRQQQKSYWQHVAGNKNNQAYEFNDNNELPQRMSTHKINGYNRSVKSSMPAALAAISREMSSPAATATATATKNALQQLWPTRFISARPRRLGAGGIFSAKIAANRLHSTRSMSTMPRQQQQQHRRLSTPMSSSSSASRYRRREQQHQQQQQITTKAQPPTSSSLSSAAISAAPTTTTSSNAEQQQQHQVKSLTNLDPLLWRQLQLLQQKALTMRHAQLSPRQHLPQQQPQETQLDVAAAAGAGADAVTAAEADVDDDIDYFYFNI